MSVDNLTGRAALELRREAKRRRCSYVVIDRRLPPGEWDGSELIPSFHRSIDLAVSTQRRYGWRHQDDPHRCAIVCEVEGERLGVVDPI